MPNSGGILVLVPAALTFLEKYPVDANSALDTCLTYCDLVVPYGEKHRSGSALSQNGQAIACCLMTPSHSLNQCGLI